MVPTWMRGTRVESAVSVLQPSSIAPSRSFVLGMKWSVTQATSHFVASACFHSSRTAGHVWLPMLVNMPKRIAGLLSVFSLRFSGRPDQGGAAVHHQDVAGDVAGVTRQQEARGLADVPAGAFTGEHGSAPPLLARRGGHAARVDHRGVDRAGGDAVDADAVGAVVHRHRSAERDHRAL